MSQMIEVKTVELSGPALDWAVAQAEEVSVFPSRSNAGMLTCWLSEKPKQQYSPSTRWRQAGPLIDKFHTDLHFDGRAWWAQANTVKGNAIAVRHEHPLTAACRAIVAAKLGDTVAVPAELLP